MTKVVVLEENNNSESLFKDLMDMGIKVIRCPENEVLDVYTNKEHEVMIIKKDNYGIIENEIKTDFEKALSVVDATGLEYRVSNCVALTNHVLCELAYQRSMENEKTLVLSR